MRTVPDISAVISSEISIDAACNKGPSFDQPAFATDIGPVFTPRTG